jgi:hypothetical protein
MVSRCAATAILEVRVRWGRHRRWPGERDGSGVCWCVFYYAGAERKSGIRGTGRSPGLTKHTESWLRELNRPPRGVGLGTVPPDSISLVTIEES